MQSNRTPNWRKWCAVPEVKLWEGVALSLGIDPDVLEHQHNGWRIDGRRFDELGDFIDRLFILGRNLGNDHRLKPTMMNIYDAAEHSVRLSGFVAWAKSLNWKMPRQLAKLAAQYEQTKPPSHGKAVPIGERERATLLTIIAALAKEADIDLSEPYKAGNQIETLTVKIGARVAAGTIAAHLGRIPDALERRNQE